MNKSPVAVGLAMIMGISVVFAFDRVKPIDEMPAYSMGKATQNQTSPQIESDVSQPDIEANILTDEAPLILDAGGEQQAKPNSAYAADVQPIAENPTNRTLQQALADMQIALAVLEKEAALTRQAVALWEQKFSQ